ncbi:hypothetical protein B7463_g10, partial [Scytalidium lignicola]
MEGGPQIWLAISGVVFLLGILITASIACDLSGHRAFSTYDQPPREQWSSSQATQIIADIQPNRNAKQNYATTELTHTANEPSQVSVINSRDSEETRWSMFYERHADLGRPDRTVPGDVAKGSVPGAQGAEAGPVPKHLTDIETTEQERIRHGSTKCSSIRINMPASVPPAHSATIGYAQYPDDSSSIERPAEISPPPDRLHRRMSSTPSLNSIERAKRFARRNTSITSSSSISPAWPRSLPEENYCQEIEMQDMASPSSGIGGRNQTVYDGIQSSMPALWNVHNYEMSRTNVRRVEPVSQNKIRDQAYTSETQDEDFISANDTWATENGWQTHNLHGSQPSRKIA